MTTVASKWPPHCLPSKFSFQGALCSGSTLTVQPHIFTAFSCFLCALGKIVCPFQEFLSFSFYLTQIPSNLRGPVQGLSLSQSLLRPSCSLFSTPTALMVFATQFYTLLYSVLYHVSSWNTLAFVSLIECLIFERKGLMYSSYDTAHSRHSYLLIN